METKDIQPVDYWIHPEKFIYTGDRIVGARAATEEEIAAHLAEVTGLGE